MRATNEKQPCLCTRFTSLRGVNDDVLAHTSRFVFVRDGFHFWAFVLAPLWMLRHRLWLEFIAYAVLIGAIAVALRRLGIEGVWPWIALLLSLLVGIEASSLRRWKLSRRDFANLGVVVGEDREHAERRFFDGWVQAESAEPSSPASPPPTPFGRPPSEPSSDIIGLFPQPEARSVTVAIVDYGSGNLHSAAKAFERAARESGHDQPHSRHERPLQPCARPSASCCPASAPSRTAAAGSMRCPGWWMRSTRRCGRKAGRSSASASACSSWPSAAANTP